MNAVDQIHSFQKFGWVLGLERINKLLELLGNPEKNLKVIHIAGTNGKGSVSRYVYEALEAARYKCGLFTSPFIECFNERIEFDHEYISNEELDSYTNRVMACVQQMLDEGMESPTEFEVITAIALLYFFEKKCDYVVLEVGLGGRGDSTNVIERPLCTVITSISYDHTDRLGNTLTEIASEKAGIIKQNSPLVTSARTDEALEVIRAKAKEFNAPIYETKDLSPFIKERRITGCTFDVEILGHDFSDIEINMTGDYQVENAICALNTLKVLRDGKKAVLSDDDIKKGMKNAKLPARFEIMQENPLVILDGSHNPDGAKQLKNIADEWFCDKKVLMIVGMLRDKDVDHALNYFTGIGTSFIATESDNPRKMTSGELCERISDKGKPCISVSNAIDACKYAKENAKDYDVILVAGSLYLAGLVRTYIKNTEF